VKFSLPTEAQWNMPAGREVQAVGFWRRGVDLGEYAWYDGNSGARRIRWGEEAERLGLFDMHGNVWEWCQMGMARIITPIHRWTIRGGLPTGSFRVDRGGGWLYAAWLCRSAFRDYGSPGYGYRYWAFVSPEWRTESVGEKR